MKVGDEVIVEILQVTTEGDGLAKKDGYIFRVKDALPLKTVRVKITSIDGIRVYADLMGVVYDEDKL